MNPIHTLNTIGLLGGISWESSALYYRDINLHVRDALGGLYSAPIVLDSVNFAQIEAWQRTGAWDEAADHLSQRAQALEHAGASCIAIATNTMHKVYTQIAAAVNVPVLHIATPTISALQAAGIQRIALLGTRYSMAQDFLKVVYQNADIDVLVPDDDGQTVVHDVIFNELCQGVVLDASRIHYQNIINTLVQQGAQAVVLGCTEITLLLKAHDVNVPLFDTTALHTRALADVVLKTTSNPNSMSIQTADPHDAEDILSLQKLSYQSEASIYNNWSLPPLLQTLDEIQEEFNHCIFLKALIDGQLVGSVRFSRINERVFIGRLIVHPNWQGQGIGSKLLAAAEKHHVDALVFELFTGSLSTHNIDLYKRHGYNTCRTETLSPSVSLIYLEKKRVL